jgi:AcrR family transcriptional regulator
MPHKPRRIRLSPRKQATQARAFSTVDVIVEAAAHILEEAGIEGYTTNAIARRAGVSIGSLYQYFPGKDAITIVLIDRETAGVLVSIEQAAADPDWRQALATMVSVAVDQQLRRPKLARLLDIEKRRLPNPPREKRVIDIVFPAVIGVLGRSGLVSPELLSTAALDVMAITRGMTDDAGARGETADSDLEGRIFRAILGYLEQGVGRGAQ